MSAPRAAPPTEPVLVTGGTGFVGSAVVRALLRAGHGDVRVLARPTSPRANLAGLSVRVLVGDLTDPSSLRGAVAGVRTLFHVAGHYRLWARRPDAFYGVNVEGTRHLIEAAAAAGVERIVYTSSVATLASGGGQPSSERDRATAADLCGHYKRSKFEAERVVERLAARLGLDVVIVHPSAPIGPRDRRPTPTGRVVLDAAAGRMPGYVDTGLNIVHVDDVGEGHRLAAVRGRRGERYVLGGENLPLREILARIAHHAGRRPPRLRLAPGPLWPLALLAEAWGWASGREPILTRDTLRMARRPMYFTSAKAGAELGYDPRPAEHAFRDSVAWFRAAGRLPAALAAPLEERHDPRSAS